MKKKHILGAFLVACIGCGDVVKADENVVTEKCKVVDKKGRGIIKEGKGDCSDNANSCAGHNKSGDPEAWIFVPKGLCEKINKREWNDVPEVIKAKIDCDKKH